MLSLSTADDRKIGHLECITLIKMKKTSQALYPRLYSHLKETSGVASATDGLKKRDLRSSWLLLSEQTCESFVGTRCKNVISLTNKVKLKTN